MIAFARNASDSRRRRGRRWPRLLASYKNCLSCQSCLLTHSDPKEGRKIDPERERERGGNTFRREKKSALARWCCGVCGIIACKATTLCERRQQHNGGGDRRGEEREGIGERY